MIHRENIFFILICKFLTFDLHSQTGIFYTYCARKEIKWLDFLEGSSTQNIHYMHCSKIISQTLKFDPNLILNFMMIIEACRLSWLHSCEHFKLAFLFLFLSSFFRLPFSFPFSTFSIFHDEAESTTLDHRTLYRYNL